jgi:hypothetical protein
MMNEFPDLGDTRGEDAADAARPLAPETETPAIPGAAPGKTLTPEATRALLEAEARRKAAPPQDLPPEINGRGGEEPTRYGDWEKRGLAADF